MKQIPFLYWFYNNFATFIVVSFFFTFTLATLTTPYVNHTHPIQFLGLVFEQQIRSFFVSIMGTVGTLIGYSIYNSVFK